MLRTSADTTFIRGGSRTGASGRSFYGRHGPRLHRGWVWCETAGGRRDRPGYVAGGWMARLVLGVAGARPPLRRARGSFKSRRGRGAFVLVQWPPEPPTMSAARDRGLGPGESKPGTVGGFGSAHGFP